MAVAGGRFCAVAATTVVLKPAAVTSRMQLDMDFSIGRVGSVAVGEAVASPPAVARPKPHPAPRVCDRDELQSD